MTQEKNRGFIEGNKFIFYVVLPIGLAIYQVVTTGWKETDYWDELGCRQMGNMV